MIRTLLVDDEPLLLDLACTFLEEEKDISVTPVASAEEALDLLGTSSYDVVVSDYQMPSMDGLELLQAVRVGHPGLPFILFTGRGREQVVIEAQNCGADFYIQKGGDPVAQFAELVSKIRHAVGRRRAEAALRESERQYRHLFEHSRDAIIVRTDGGVILKANRAACEMLGYSLDALVGRTVTDFTLDETEKERGREALRMVAAMGDVTFRTRWVRSDGREIDVEIASQSTCPEKGIGQGIVRDISGSRQTASALWRRDLILDAVVRAAGLLLRDPGATIEAALAGIGESAGAARAYILEREAGKGGAGRMVHAWSAAGAALPCHAVTVPEGEGDGGILRYEVSDGWRGACILLPLPVDGGRSCYLGLDAPSPARDWSVYECEALEAAAQVVGAALARGGPVCPGR